MHPRPLHPVRRLVSSLLTALGSALAVHLAVVLVYFATNGAAAENLVPLSSYFLPTSIALFVVWAIAAALGAFRTWLGSLVAGLVGGVVASIVGTAFTIVSSGAAWSSEVTTYLFTSLIGTNLIFEITATIVAVTLARWLWTKTSTWTRSLGRMVALVRPPSSRLQEGELTHLERNPVDTDLAEDQWDAYVTALTEEGFDVIDVPAADDHPDSVFIEDAVVMFDQVAVITSPGAQSRRGEIEAVRDTVRKLGLRTEEVQLPGTLDGGDVLKVGSTVYVGRGGRTNAEGIRQLRAIVAPLGYTVIAVPIKKALHLKSAVTALPDGTVIGYPKLLESPAVFERFLPVPEAHGAAVVVLAPDAVLMSSAAPKTAALIADLGYRVVTVDISEFEKLEGCVTCLSVRIR